MKDGHPKDGMSGYAARDVVANSILSYIKKETSTDVYEEINKNIDRYVDAYLFLYNNMLDYDTENDRTGYLIMCNIIAIAIADSQRK